jgi:pimeloyl-ACP methyl ester carboxylesterase
MWGPPTGLLGNLEWMLRHRLYGLVWLVGRLSQLSPLTTTTALTFYVHHPRRFWINQAAQQTCKTSYTWTRQQSLWNLAVMLETLASCDIRPLVAELSLPVLAITGEQDAIVPPEQTLWLAQNLPHTDLHLLRNVGHMTNLEAPDELVRLMTEWLTTTAVTVVKK